MSILRWQAGSVTASLIHGAIALDFHHQRWWIGVPRAPSISSMPPRGYILYRDDAVSLGQLLIALSEASTAGLQHVTLLHPLLSERCGMLAETWGRGWPDAVRLDVDAAQVHTPLHTSDLTVSFDGRDGVRVELAGVCIAIATAAHRLRGANLGILYVADATALPIADRQISALDTLWLLDASGEPVADTSCC